MLGLKLLTLAAIIELVRADIRPSEYINIAIGEGGLHIVHPSLYANPGDSTYFRSFSSTVS